MREILFRGKAVIDVECPDYCGESDVKNGDWVFGDLVWNNGVPFIVKNVIESNWEYISIEAWTPVDPSTVGQYTGLKDKNGKMIFEGDFLCDGKGQDGVVVYYESIASFLLTVENLTWNLNEGDPNRATQLQYTKIIGNIHDQKEDV